MLKRDFEKKLRKEEEVATAHVFQEFLQSFQTTPLPKSKTFVRSGVLHPSNKQEEDEQKGKIYTPKPLFKREKPIAMKEVIECTRLVKENKVERVKEKPKSTLEVLKEEFKMKHLLKDSGRSKIAEGSVSLSSNDPTTTNLFVANLNSSVTENDLIALFGAYGPLASVKIMWPRADDKIRSTNCGFVAFMSRKDGERALKDFRYRDDMKVGWAKSVEIPRHPIYVPPDLLKMYLPPPPSGLPFNAQPLSKSFTEPSSLKEMNELLHNCKVKVVIPLNKLNLMIVHRMVEFVAKEGPSFEAIIMNREINNPLYQFLFDNKSVTHIYYRWKLYSILHGESPTEWSMKQFRMFKGGSIWIPPSVPDYSKGMPEQFITTENSLSDSQYARFVQYIRNMNMQRTKIAGCMQFCLNHQIAVKDIVDIITDSFKDTKTAPTKKIARLYLINDILCNTVNKRTQKNNTDFQKKFQERLLLIFQYLQETLKNIQAAAYKEEFKRRIEKVLKAWDVWKIYEESFLNKLKNLITMTQTSDNEDSDTEGPLDGKSIIKRSLKNKVETNVSIAHSSCFVPSKWEMVDPQEIEAQAMSTKKLYDMEFKRQQEEAASKMLTEKDRKRLREIEVKVLEFQEELEMGDRLPKKGHSVEDEIRSYREHLKSKVVGTSERKRHRSKSKSRSLKKARN